MNKFLVFVCFLGAVRGAPSPAPEPHSYHGELISPPLTKPFCTEKNLTEHCILADCKILFQPIVTTEIVNITTKVCTTEMVHQCQNKTLETCGYQLLMVPVTETIEECVANDLRMCQQHWACKDDAVSDNPLKKITINGEGDPCEDDEFRDDPNNCLELPQSICSEKEVEIEYESRKRVCKDNPYEDCAFSVPQTTCTDDLKQREVTHTENVPYRICTPVLFPVVPIYPVLPYWKK